MATQTAGIVAAAAGIASVSSVYNAVILLSSVAPAAGPKVMVPTLKKVMPYNVSLVLTGTIAAFVQASKAQATKSLWLASGLLFVVSLPYTLIIDKDNLKTVSEGAANDKPVAKEVWHKMAFHSCQRGTAIAAATALAIFALVKKVKK